MSDDTPPSAQQLADRLAVERELLVQYVTFHPNPTAKVVLGWADADESHREAVEAWLADREEGRPDPDLGDADPDRVDRIRRRLQ